MQRLLRDLLELKILIFVPVFLTISRLLSCLILNLLKHLLSTETFFYRSWRDVQQCGWYWDTPLEHSSAQQADQLFEQFVQMIWRFQLFDQPIRWSYLHFIPALRFGENSATQRDLIRNQPVIDHNRIAINLDKDPKRMCTADLRGYWFRLSCGFLNDAEHYQHYT